MCFHLASHTCSDVAVLGYAVVVLFHLPGGLTGKGIAHSNEGLMFMKAHFRMC